MNDSENDQIEKFVLDIVINILKLKFSYKFKFKFSKYFIISIIQNNLKFYF